MFALHTLLYFQYYNKIVNSPQCFIISLNQNNMQPSGFCTFIDSPSTDAFQNGVVSQHRGINSCIFTNEIANSTIRRRSINHITAEELELTGIKNQLPYRRECPQESYAGEDNHNEDIDPIGEGRSRWLKANVVEKHGEYEIQGDESNCSYYSINVTKER
ncbi:hypothetical protein RHGRI_005985 [Rhododendron griersonianum]|uniref:Uncharacterized protein n=1 Tax=Rhododendron griersonianum TaxID=479676 RepID=A0AAV6LE76_9ERIC|nr:hypothetical protein RHGRI_005985 [Rhododendron griersonianum]